MRFVRAECAADEEEYLYRAYLTESLRLQHENKYLSRSWMDMANHTPPPRERTGDEIAMDVIMGAGLHMEPGA